jgi:glycine cleavage system H protein
MNTPKELFYTKDHEWATIDGDTATIGITDFAVSQLGDITLVELPEIDDSVEAGETMGTVESVKAVSELYSPISGQVMEINEKLEEEPELVNEDPFGQGWMIKITISDMGELDSLLDADAYAAHCEEGGSD